VRWAVATHAEDQTAPEPVADAGERPAFPPAGLQPTSRPTPSTTKPTASAASANR
jgi:hypothetical protein